MLGGDGVVEGRCEVERGEKAAKSIEMGWRMSGCDGDAKHDIFPGSFPHRLFNVSIGWNGTMPNVPATIPAASSFCTPPIVLPVDCG